MESDSSSFLSEGEEECKEEGHSSSPDPHSDVEEDNSPRHCYVSSDKSASFLPRLGGDHISVGFSGPTLVLANLYRWFRKIHEAEV